MVKNEAKKSSIKVGKFDISSIEYKWRMKWEKEGTYEINLDRAKNPFYLLMMFPYPSAEGLHIGGVRTFSGVDIYGRYKRMRGFDVFMPFGLDGFGIHAENYALKIGAHPMKHAKVTEENFYRQIKEAGLAIDWSKTVETYKKEYYKWTQWVFVQMFKAGLARRKKSAVNWCPSCKTVLADEQVIDGKCERCDKQVIKKMLEQWFLGITEYAERLNNNIDKLDWPDTIKIAQRNWIGKSDGLLFESPVKDSLLKLKTFNAHFEAFMADTFIVIAPDHPLLEKLIEDVANRLEILDFCKKVLDRRKEEGFVDEKEVEGIFTGRYVVDPVGNGELPIWVASYALADYGTGIVKCSAHDERDFAFAKKYGIKMKTVLFPKDMKAREKVERQEVCYTDMVNGCLKEPVEFEGMRAGDLREDIIRYVEERGLAERKTNYKLRDWLISRQRYWGPPIPMIYCEKCAKKGKSWFDTLDAKKFRDENSGGNRYGEIQRSEVAGWYPDDNLPVELPYVENFKPMGRGKSPLANNQGFYKVVCPGCGDQARRETDVSDTFLDSSWYFLRYLATDWESIPFPVHNFLRNNTLYANKEDRDELDRKISCREKFLPVNMYIGGAEHAVLHLLYARFAAMFFYDCGFLDFDEPFSRFYAHGLIIKDGAKMSKSKGNVVSPDLYVKKLGADTLRMYLNFLAPFDAQGDFRDTGIEGMYRFLKRVWVLLGSRVDVAKKRQSLDEESLREMHRTIKGVTDDMEGLRFNTAIAKLMTWYNFLYKKEFVSLEEGEIYLRLIAPLAPHLAEELWEVLAGREKRSIHLESWPKFDSKYIKGENVNIVVQVNGKTRVMIEVGTSDIENQSYIENMAFKNDKLEKYLEGKKIVKIIYVAGKVLNFVVR